MATLILLGPSFAARLPFSPATVVTDTSGAAELVAAHTPPTPPASRATATRPTKRVRSATAAAMRVSIESSPARPRTEVALRDRPCCRKCYTPEVQRLPLAGRGPWVAL